MFFPDKIKLIRNTDRVLEIGPGSLPHPRADVFLELEIQDNQERLAQRGYAKKINLNKPVVFYNGGEFPFKDKEFDYVICSHVLEHVPLDKIDNFISELLRIAPKGYIEFPTVFYELINYQDVHLSLMNMRDNKVLFMDKNNFKSNNIHKIYRKMFYGKDDYLKNIFKRYKELFFIGFEWENTIAHEITDDYELLVDDYDIKKFDLYFDTLNLKMINENKSQKIKKIVAKILKKFSLKKDYSICKGVVLEDKKFIQINKFVEIKENVIIKTFKNPVHIGDYTQINPNTVIYGGSGVYIGKNVMIAPNCVIAAGNHNYKQIEKPMRFTGCISKGPIIIEDNVWIGANTTITDGVRIGKDSMVAANSVVTHDIEPYDIVAGVPARVIGNRKRISEEASSKC